VTGLEEAGVLARGARPRRPPAAVIDVAIGALVVLLIASPLLFTSDGFFPDFTNSIWMADYQRHAITAYLHPTLFLHTQQSGVFEPQFAFYGGTLFAVTGALAAALGGSTIAAFEILTVAAIAAAYGGIFWLARQLGVKGLLAHAPAIVFVTSAYYVTNLYGRGAWAEFMAVSALPLVLAASLRLARGRWRAGPVLCLVAATVIFSGSHNVTLLWGATLALVALACYWLLSGRSRELPWRWIGASAALVALAIGLNSWFLLPDVSYAHDTMIAGRGITWSVTSFFNTFGVIFDPLRTVPRESETPALYVQVPVLALAWGLIAAPLYWRQRRLRAGLITALLVLGGVLAAIMSSGVWSALPSPYQQAQYAFRLQTYVALACAGLVLVGALALTRRAQSGQAARSDRLLTLALGLTLAFGVAVCAWQLWVPNTHVYEANSSSLSNRAEALGGPPTLLPRSWQALHDYGDRSLPVVAARERFTFSPAAVKDDKLAGPAALPPGPEPFATNIVGGPYLVHVAGGAYVVGRTSEGELVLKRTREGSQPVDVELTAQLSTPVLLGRIATAASAALLLAWALAAAVRRRRRRSAARPSALAGGGTPQPRPS
jgi:hypothetical protein